MFLHAACLESKETPPMPWLCNCRHLQQTQPPTPSARMHVAGQTSTWFSLSSWLHPNALESHRRRETKPIFSKRILLKAIPLWQALTDLNHRAVGRVTAGAFCRDIRLSAETKASIMLYYKATDWTEFLTFLFMPSPFGASVSFLLKIRRLQQVAFISALNSRFHNSMFNLPSKEKFLFL